MRNLAEVKDQCQAGMERDLPSPFELVWGPYLGDKAPDVLKMIWMRDELVMEVMEVMRMKMKVMRLKMRLKLIN